MGIQEIRERRTARVEAAKAQRAVAKDGRQEAARAVEIAERAVRAEEALRTRQEHELHVGQGKPTLAEEALYLARREYELANRRIQDANLARSSARAMLREFEVLNGGETLEEDET